MTLCYNDQMLKANFVLKTSNTTNDPTYVVRKKYILSLTLIQNWMEWIIDKCSGMQLTITCHYVFHILSYYWVWHIMRPMLSIDLFLNNFFPSGKQPEHHKLAYELSTSGCIAIFQKYCYCTKRGGIATNLILLNRWGYVTNVPKYNNAGIWRTD